MDSKRTRPKPENPALLDALYGLRGRARGSGQWSPPVCLSERFLEAHPGELDRAAVRYVLTEAREILAVESGDLADLLLGRFWEGLTVEKMVEIGRPQPWQERNFQLQQRRAIERLAQILEEMERRCLNQQVGITAAPPPSPTSVVPPPPAPNHRLVFGAITLVLLAVAGGWIIVQPLAPASDLGRAATLVPPATVNPPSACGEAARVPAPATPQFLRHQGVSEFTSEAMGGLVHNNKVRALAIDKRGLWAGFFATDVDPRNGLANSNKQTWADCDTPEGTRGKDINDIAIDHQGRVWVAAEKTGVAMYDGSHWRTFTEKDGLPSSDTFGLTVDRLGHVWVCTWNGVATFDGKEWSTPFTTLNDTLASDHAHAIAFDSTGDVWVGLIRDGVSRFRHADGSWMHLTKEGGSLSGNEVRAILVRPEQGRSPESVWIATNDGGISVYEKDTWSHYTADTGLLSNSVTDLALDRYNRVWAVTSSGVAYRAGDTWITYMTLPSLSIAIGPEDCDKCPYDGDNVLVGTMRNGITHSRIPLDVAAIEVVKVDYPKVVAPGQRFVPKITIAPRPPYKLIGPPERGDFLANIDDDDTHLFGAFEHMEVKGTIQPPAAFTFSDPNLPFVAPQLPAGVPEETFTSTWRMWMFTRYVGPPIPITFTVKR